MKYNKLGSSGVDVSDVCLGTMTWGLQNNQQQADEQMEYSLAQGINFIDTAEMYSVPPSRERYGATEKIIGDWLSRNPERRKEWILATKIAGKGVEWIRDGGFITGESIIKSVDDSLARLNTDYIDLYQLHWPNRAHPHFGMHNLNHIQFDRPNREQEIASFLSILQALQDCVKAGKIRYCGLSDDTPWGITQYLNLSEKHSLPRMVSIQNEFNLLHAKDWPYLVETCVQEDIAFLPWSPLAGGALSGKYLNGARPEGSRWTISQRMGLFRNTPEAEAAVTEYVGIAAEHNMSPSQLALAWCQQVHGVASTIIGATSMSQLKENIAAFNMSLSDDALKQISAVLRKYPMPF